jgi:antitoxin component YwqK of YwqJK toxin-antitoxin module
MIFGKILLVLMVFLCVSCDNQLNTESQKTGNAVLTVEKDDLNFLPEKGLVLYLNKPYSGIAISFYENGKNKESSEYYLGKRNGAFQKWFEDGNLSYESQYLAGKQHGITRSWWKNGNLRSESNFENGEAQGTQLQYYQSGTLFKKMQLQQGREEGLQQA